MYFGTKGTSCCEFLRSRGGGPKGGGTEGTFGNLRGNAGEYGGTLSSLLDSPPLRIRESSAPKAHGSYIRMLEGP